MPEPQGTGQRQPHSARKYFNPFALGRVDAVWPP